MTLVIFLTLGGVWKSLCCSKSVRLNTALAVSGLTPLLVGRLDHQDAIARLNLLKMIKVSLASHFREFSSVIAKLFSTIPTYCLVSSFEEFSLDNTFG